eukprot:Blabericola_migrator_1__5562@NODE_2832_length_2302_cov_45_041611_g1777_i0_p2_GENE_NODE_2832_length_2302_cov_45_041611_g1777_i0NODE_2832_length_2302_cov_45_041611_g1777_i0_p2_ORF_typecomplete_len150_score13_09_NODE_2832_length_2302_cov_45_041611_g1777_i016862135
MTRFETSTVVCNEMEGPIQKRDSSRFLHQALPPNIVRPYIVDREERKTHELNKRALERQPWITDYLQIPSQFEPFIDDNVVLTKLLQQVPQQLSGEHAIIMDTWIYTAIKLGRIQKVDQKLPQAIRLCGLPLQAVNTEPQFTMRGETST